MRASRRMVADETGNRIIQLFVQGYRIIGRCLRHRVSRFGGRIMTEDRGTPTRKPPRHVGAHAPQTDHQQGRGRDTRFRMR